MAKDIEQVWAELGVKEEVMTERPECLGLLGWLFGHRYETTFDGRKMRAVIVPWCTRCGLKAHCWPAPMVDRPDEGTTQP